MVVSALVCEIMAQAAWMHGTSWAGAAGDGVETKPRLVRELSGWSTYQGPQLEMDSAVQSVGHSKPLHSRGPGRSVQIRERRLRAGEGQGQASGWGQSTLH